MKAIIIGGGIGGLTAAIALQQAGHEAEVYERAPEFREVGAGIALWANAVKALGKLGLGDALRAMAITDGAAGINTSRGDVLTAMTVQDTVKHFGAPTFIVHRAELHALLMGRVRALCAGKKCVAIEQNAHEVIAHFDDGSMTRGDLLIGADGIRSVVRGQYFPDCTPRYAGYVAWRGMLNFEHQRVKIWGESWGAGARFGLTPVMGDRIYWYATLNAPAGASGAMPPDATRQKLLDIYAGWHEPIAEVLKATDPTQILTNDIYDLPPLKSWSVGRVTLLGDAAHATTPNMGQGACQAIEDALVLAKVMQSDVADSLKQYEAARIHRANKVVSMSRMIGSVAQWENPVLCAARNAVFKHMPAGVRLKQIGEVAAYEV